MGALKSVLNNGGMVKNVAVSIRRSNCTNVFALCMRSADRRKVNVIEMKCVRSLIGVTRMDRVRNDGVRRRMGIERELTSRVDQRLEMVWTRGENG